MMTLRFSDTPVPYTRFLDDLAEKVVEKIEQRRSDPPIICQNEAFRLFGRANVERWRRQGRVEAFKRPGKVEYRTADLRRLQQSTQDYFC